MKFFDLDGKICHVNIQPYKREANRVSVSEGQNNLALILLQMWPSIALYEEVPCAGTKLRLDFFIPALKIAFEFDGQQHETYDPFFHGSRYRWLQSKHRDCTKEEWCRRNGITLIRVNAKDVKQGIEHITQLVGDTNGPGIR